MKILFLIKSLKTPSSRIRVLDLIPELKNQSIEAEVEVISSSFFQKRRTFWKTRSFPIVVLQKKLLSVLEFFELRKNSKFLIFDFDDAIYCKNASPSSNLIDYNSPTRMRKFVRTIEGVDMIITANKTLASKVREITHLKPVNIIPSSVDFENILRKENYNLHNPPIIGWIGTQSTLRYIEYIAPALRELRKTYDFILRIISDDTLKLPDIKIDFIPWSLKTQNSELRNFDIGIMPLSSDLFSEGKSAYKLLLYLAAGLPSVCSPVGMNAEIAESGKACLAANSSKEFSDNLKKLLEDYGLRKSLGIQGRKVALENYDKKIIAGKLAKILHSVKT